MTLKPPPTRQGWLDVAALRFPGEYRPIRQVLMARAIWLRNQAALGGWTEATAAADQVQVALDLLDTPAGRKAVK